ncbi:MAG: hypothetical protein WBX25_07510, partial [Rhodomicrobium sp.]
SRISVSFLLPHGQIEPEILHSALTLFCLTSADPGHKRIPATTCRPAEAKVPLIGITIPILMTSWGAVDPGEDVNALARMTRVRHLHRMLASPYEAKFEFQNSVAHARTPSLKNPRQFMKAQCCDLFGSLISNIKFAAIHSPERSNASFADGLKRCLRPGAITTALKMDVDTRLSVVCHRVYFSTSIMIKALFPLCWEQR